MSAPIPYSLAQTKEDHISFGVADLASMLAGRTKSAELLRVSRVALKEISQFAS